MKPQFTNPTIRFCLWPILIPMGLLAAAMLPAGCKTAETKELEARADDYFESGSNRPPSAETLFSMARIAKAQGKDELQDYILRKTIQEHPRFLPAYNDLAELEIRLNRIDEAMAIIQAGLRRTAGDPVLTNNMGMCRLLKGEHEQALESFAAASKLDPDATRFRSNMALALGMLGRYEESLSLFLQIVPEWEAHYNLAVICEARKDRARAAEEFKAAEELKPKETASTSGQWWGTTGQLGN